MTVYHDPRRVQEGAFPAILRRLGFTQFLFRLRPRVASVPNFA